MPIRQGQALFRAITGPKQFVTIRGGDYNDVKPADPETYWRAVSDFIESLADDRGRDGPLPR